MLLSFYPKGSKDSATEIVGSDAAVDLLPGVLGEQPGEAMLVFERHLKVVDFGLVLAGHQRHRGPAPARAAGAANPVEVCCEVAARRVAPPA